MKTEKVITLIVALVVARHKLDKTNGDKSGILICKKMKNHWLTATNASS